MPCQQIIGKKEVNSRFQNHFWEIAVNKLLDVLRKDTTPPPIEAKKTITADDDDDWIGGKADDASKHLSNTPEVKLDLASPNNDETIEAMEPTFPEKPNVSFK